MAIKVSMNPMLYTDRNGQKWAVSGQHWVKVPETLTLDRVGEYLLWEPSVLPEPAESKSWAVEGSKGNIYTVTERDGQLSCTSPGYGWRRKCKHIESANKK